MTDRAPAWLLDFQESVYSQQGEDGVIRKALEMLPARDRWCVEFGAWDGMHLSNTRNLIEHHGYSAVLIEGSRRKFRELRGNYASNPKVTPINAFVGFTAADGLDSILSGTPIPQDFDFLCVDIDGNDYHVWSATCHYRPKIVCIEFNPTIQTGVEFVQKADPAVNQGSSLAALARLGANKGYELICVLPFNAIFVRRELFPLYGIRDNSLRTLRKDLSLVTHLFTGFDGSVFIRGASRMPWHGLPLKESNVQQLPRFLRAYPGNYNAVQRVLLRLLRFLRS